MERLPTLKLQEKYRESENKKTDTSVTNELELPGEWSSNTMAIVLAGGKGERMKPLSLTTPKPFLPLGEQHKILDVSIAASKKIPLKCAHVAMHKEDTRFIDYLEERWGNFVRIIDEKIPRGHGRVLMDNIKVIESDPSENVIIAPGDHVHNIEFGEVISSHNKRNADLTIISKEVPYEESERHDIVDLDENRVRGFRRANLNSENFASVGIYIFRKRFLLPILRSLVRQNPEHADIGKDILPAFLKKGRVDAFKFDDYWEDLGTLDRYYRVNMELLVNPEILSRSGIFKFNFNRVDNNFVSSDSTISKNASIKNSIINRGCIVDDGVVMNGVILLDGVSVESGVDIKNIIVGENQYLTKDFLSKLSDDSVKTPGGLIVIRGK